MTRGHVKSILRGLFSDVEMPSVSDVRVGCWRSGENEYLREYGMGIVRTHRESQSLCRAVRLR